MDPDNTEVSSGCAKLHFSSWGATGPVMVALHPGVGDSRIWDASAQTWVGAGYRVVGYDRRGFGFTTSSAEPHDDLDDLLAVLDAASAEPVVVVGNSRGGGLALDLALAHPERVRALVLLAPSPSGYDDSKWPTATEEAEQDLLLAAAEESGNLLSLNRLETRYWLDGVAQAEGRVEGKPRELFMDMNSRALHAPPIGESSVRQPAWPNLHQIGVPVLVVVGEFDLPGIKLQCRALAEALPLGSLVEIPRSAHCPQLDQADLLAETVLTFLSASLQVEPSPPPLPS